MTNIKNIVIVVLFVAVLGLIYLQFGALSGVGVLSAEEAVDLALSHINNEILQGRAEASLVGDVVEDNGLYQFQLSISGEEFASYITKDGAIFFPEGISLITKEADVITDEDEEEEEPDTAALNQDGHTRGDAEATVTIVEFSDFQCPFCSKFHETMKQVMENYQGQVKWVYKHFPLDSIHPYARQAAEASECAGEQDQFWEYADGLYSQQSEISPDFLKELAEIIGLETAQFNECLDFSKYANKVESDYQEGIAAGVSGTPGSFVNGQALGGAVPYETIEEMIDNLIF